MNSEIDEVVNEDLDCSAIEVVPLEPFLNWVNQHVQDGKVTMEELEDDANVYLIPACDTEEELLEVLGEKYPDILINELYDWCPEESEWPEDKSFEKFKEFFAIKFHSMVIDLT